MPTDPVPPDCSGCGAPIGGDTADGCPRCGSGPAPLDLDEAAALVRCSLDDPDCHSDSPDPQAVVARDGLWLPAEAIRALLEHAEADLADEAAADPVPDGPYPSDRPTPRTTKAGAPRPVAVRCSDADPAEFHYQGSVTSRAAGHHAVVDVLERWVERSRWPSLSLAPIGGDRVRAWKVLARPSDLPGSTPVEVVLRQRPGPGVWSAAPAALPPRRRRGPRRAR